MARIRRIWLSLIILTSSTAARGADWPQSRGPNRDGKSAETALLRKWPEGGPRLLWSVGGLGTGFSSVAVANGIIYTTGMSDAQGFLFAYDLDGKLRFKVPYGPEWRGSHRGTRTTPTVDGEKVYCTPGGPDGVIVALDKMTGQTVWATTGVEELSAYCSPILIQRGPNRLLVNMIQKSIICVRAEDGRLLWQVPYAASYDTAANTPVYSDGMLYVTSIIEREATTGGLMLELAAGGTSVTTRWTDQRLDCHHGGVVLVDGYLYGSNFKGITRGDWVCLEWRTGKVMYEARWNGNKGSLIYADGMLYCYDENTGDVGLVRASPAGFEVVSSFRVTAGSGEHWAHPAISDGRLYIRHGNALMVYDIRDG